MLSKLLSLLAKWLWIRELGLMNGLAIIISIYVHEYGHYFMAEDLGLKPKAPRFFPFLGAYVQHDNAYDDKKQFKVAFAGPLLGGIFGIVCFYIDLIFHIKFVHQLALASLNQKSPFPRHGHSSPGPGPAWGNSRRPLSGNLSSRIVQSAIRPGL